MRWKRLISLLYATALVSSIPALDIEQGDYLLRISENSGSYSLFYSDNSGELSPLFFSDNPDTSFLALRIGESLILPGSDKSVVRSLSEENNAVLLSYSWEAFRIEQRFKFREQGGEVRGLSIEYRLINLGMENLQVQMALVLDTTLGESRPSHFVSPLNGPVSSEYSFGPRTDEPYILSGNSGELSLAIFLAGADLSPPLRVVAANWKRISENPVDFQSDESRNFNLLPFSINDSALHILYLPTEIGPQNATEYRLALSAVSMGEDPGEKLNLFARSTPVVLVEQAEASAETQGVSERAPDPLPSAEDNSRSFSPQELQQIAPYLQIIDAIDVLLRQIDTMLSSGTALQEEDVLTLRDILEMLGSGTGEQSRP